MALDLQDIEDMHSAGEPRDASIRRELPSQVKRQRHANELAVDLSASPAACTDTAPAPPGVPGTESVWVKTFGCSHNYSDGEYMAGQLQAYGYRCACCLLASDNLLAA